MAVAATALADALAGIVGGAHVVSEPGALVAHAVEGAIPRFVVRPGSVEAVSGVLALATAERLAVAPRGSGSSLDLGGPPRRLDLVLDCGRLAAIVEHVPEDMVATVQAGLSLGALASRLGHHGQRWPVDPPAGAGRSVGGVLATGASGPLRFRYGTARDLVLGVRFVQADGTVTWGGAKVVKSVTGYDVPKLLVGSLGTLGVLAEITLRLHPAPPAGGTWLLPFASPEAAGGFLAALLDTTIEPARVVLVNDRAVAALGVPTSRVAVAVSIESAPEAVADQGAALGALARAHGSDGGVVPEALWSRLGDALSGPVRLRLCGDLTRLAHWLREVEQRGARLGLPVAGIGEAGSGVLWLALGGAAAEAADLDGALLRPLREALGAEDGSLVVERAPAAMKGRLDVWGPIPAGTLAIMRRLKDEFDPLGLLNAGRFVGGL